MQSVPKTSQQVLGDRAWTIVPENEADGQAWIVPKAQLDVEKGFIKLPAVLENDIRIRMTWAGMCHSDVLTGKNDWQLPLDGLYPLVPGHEIIGVVEQLGEKAKAKFQVGQTVGFGVIRSVCGTCVTCQEGLENVCPKIMWTYPPNSGGYAQCFQADADYFYSIPEGMDVSRAAPLFCAGITVYAPLKRHLRSGFKVGIAGIGGLGHLALQLADKIVSNIEVTALSGRPEKEQECLGFGAHKFLVTSEENVKAYTGYFDYILLAALGGKLTNIQICLKQKEHSALQEICHQLRSRILTLFFAEKQINLWIRIKKKRGNKRGVIDCAKHNIYPQCEFFPFSKVNQFMEKLDKSKAKYRYVIDFSQ